MARREKNMDILTKLCRDKLLNLYSRKLNYKEITFEKKEVRN